MQIPRALLPRRFEWVLYRAERLAEPDPGRVQFEFVSPRRRVTNTQRLFLRRHISALSLWRLLQWHRKGAGWIFLAREQEPYAHYSFVTPPRRYRRIFPVISEPGALLIGPSFTEPAMRGRGLYRQTLAMITARLGEEGYGPFYVFASPTNVRSLRGIERAGFQRCGVWTGTRAFMGAWIQSARKPDPSAAPAPGARATRRAIERRPEQ